MHLVKINYSFWLILSLLLFVTLVPHSFSQAPAVISSFQVLDPNGNDVTGESLVAGGSYTVKFTIEVGATLTDKILLSTNMEKSGNEFWTLENNYQGIDTSTWTPGSQSITFQAVEGVAEFTLEGKISESITERELTEVQKTVHALAEERILILQLDSMDILDQRSYVITDQTIISYDQLLASKTNNIDSTSMEEKYKLLASEIISEAEYLTTFGFYDDAIKLLDTIPDSDYPDPPVAATLYMIAAIVFVIISILLGILFIRSRSTRSYILGSVSEKADKLDLLLIKASRLDQNLSNEIETIKKELKELE